MGKPTGKKNKGLASKPDGGNAKQSKALDRNSKAFDEDTSAFINVSQELKEEGNRLFQKRDHEGAMLKYEKALKLLPRNHIDVAYLRSNMAARYMQLGLDEYPSAINECNLALEVSPRYSKALLKRARCYEGLNRLDLALRDVNYVLSVEPNNLTALEIRDSVKMAIANRDIKVGEKDVVLPPKYGEPPDKPSWKNMKEKMKKMKKSNKLVMSETERLLERKEEDEGEEDKEVVEEKRSVKEEKMVTRAVKLVLGEDIRWAQLPISCDIRLVRDVVEDRFRSLNGVLIKYRDQEGDLVTITTTDELRWAEASGDQLGPLRFYIIEVSPDKDPLYEGGKNKEDVRKVNSNLDKDFENNVGQTEKGTSRMDDWNVQFARLFKNHVGFDSDPYLDFYELGMKLYSEGMKGTVTGEDAQELFEIATEKFQEMAALAI